jgi:hypothetical protein
MPRNYRSEYDNYQSKPEQKKNRAKRNKARREANRSMGKAALKGKDIDHKKKLKDGGSNSKGNLRVRSTSSNRSDNGHYKGEGKRTKRK